jgi:predicted Rossmann fold nucleotide-binding protein DprA/Smf involved in DNA uptake
MNLGIIGSRSFNDYELLKKEVDDFIKDIKIDHIVSGGAKGADSLGEKYAGEHGIKILIFLPDWQKFGKKAGYIRNIDIIENSDIVIAFWDGESKGTKHSIDLANKMNKKVKIIYF